MKMLFLKFLRQNYEWLGDFKTQILWSEWKKKLSNTLKKCRKLLSINDKSTLKRNNQDPKEKQM